MGWLLSQVSQKEVLMMTYADHCTGAVSGPNGGVVKLQDAIKKPWPDVVSIPDMPSASASAASDASAEV